MKEQNQKSINVNQNPCPVHIVINEIMKADMLDVRPVLFDQASSQKLNERSMIAHNQRLEYSIPVNSDVPVYI
jgi:hypothetical protein